MKKQLFRKFPSKPVEINLALYNYILCILFVILFAAIMPLFVPGIQSRNPSSVELATTQLPPLIISIEGKEKYCLNLGSSPAYMTSFKELKESINKQLKKADRQTLPIWIKSAPHVKYQDIREIINWLQSIGIYQIGLVTELSS